jgi:hypothetical protein
MLSTVILSFGYAIVRLVVQFYALVARGDRANGAVGSVLMRLTSSVRRASSWMIFACSAAMRGAQVVSFMVPFSKAVR